MITNQHLASTREAVLNKEIITGSNLMAITPPMVNGTYTVILADPPWRYEHSKAHNRTIENHYPTMPLDEIKAIKVPAAENAVLYLWATAPKLPEALEVMGAWGFEYKTNMTWDKVHIGMGFWARGQHELLLIGTKGKVKPPSQSARVRSVYSEARTKHSKKPDYFNELLEKQFPDGRFWELFARRKYSDKWTVWGNEAPTEDSALNSTPEPSTPEKSVWDKSVPVEASSHINDSEPEFYIPESMSIPANQPTMMDLFSGAGGFSVGCGWAGFTPVFGIDYLEPAAMTWRKNHPNAISCLGDIRLVDPQHVKSLLASKGIYHINLMTSGVPCQGFSRANRKHTDDDSRNFLFKEFMRFAEVFTPDYLIIENVGGLRSTAGGHFEREISRHMEQLGYTVTIKLVNAADYGVPQQRHRLIFVGVRGVNLPYEFPIGLYSANATDHAYRHRTVANAISDLPGLGNNEVKTAYESPSLTDYQRLMRGEGFINIPVPASLLNHLAPNHPKETIVRIEKTLPGEPMYPSFKQRIRLKPDTPSPTQLAGGIRPQFQFGHPTQARGLSIRERARIQSFPDSYEFTGGITQERVQTGNAVPPLLVYELVKPIAEDLRWVNSADSDNASLINAGIEDVTPSEVIPKSSLESPSTPANQGFARAVVLFAGAGGTSLGSQNAGFNIVGAFEYWDKAAACYEANFTHPVFRDDLSDVYNAVNKIRALSPETIFASPPCQDFSGAGKRIEGDRASLTVSFAQIIAAVKPKFFVMENVPQVRKSKAYAEARKIYKATGYGLTETVLTASYYGVPQRRKRFFCVGALNAPDGFLSAALEQAKSDTETTVRDYLGDSLGVDHYYAKPTSKIGMKRSIFSVDEPSLTIRGTVGNIPKKFVAHPGDSCVLNSSVRPLTALERAQIQTFPIDFKWVGGKAAVEQMIGNAVPVKLAEAVASVLASYINEIAETAGFDCASPLSRVGRRAGVK